jgi:hypothetical protein
LPYKEALAHLVYCDWDFQQKRCLDNAEGIKSFYLFAQKLLTAVPAFELQVKKGGRFADEFAALLLDNRAHPIRLP